MQFALVTCILALAFGASGGHRTNLRSDSRALQSDPFFLCGSEYCVTNRSTCETGASCKCLSGFGGDLCLPINECLEGAYPCAGGNKATSFCVNYDPPLNYKCGCESPYKAVLPSQLDVMDDPSVPLDWRPVECIEEETASPTSAAPTPAPVAPTTTEPTVPLVSCEVDTDCNTDSNFECDTNTGTCICMAGFYLTPGQGSCQNENECQLGYPNDCHKFATCLDLMPPAFYSCTCNDGFQDKFPDLNKTGTVCEQVNECEAGTHDCEEKGLTCVDVVPTMKWECVDPTPAPSNSPSRSPIVPMPAPCVIRRNLIERVFAFLGGSSNDERRLAVC